MASGVSSFKLLIMSTGLLSMVIALKVSLPIMADFIAYDAPKLWSYLVSCFRPPYLYLLINSIIISILASSKLQNSSNESDSPSPVLSPPIVTIRASEQDFPDFEFKFPVTEASMDDEVVAEDEFVISKSSWMPPPLKDSKFSDKPPASTRFSSRRSPKPSPEGPKRLGVSKPNRTETLENTWRTITDGRAMPLTRHLRKSDTFSNANQTELSSPPSQLMQKSNTFGCEEKNSSSSVDFGSTGKMRREASLSHDELNRRVEAFINKFNEEMRLQRQESLNHYKRMVRS